jgi:membrane protease YdiL (CAAX protease family)
LDFSPAPSAWLVGSIAAAIVLSLGIYGVLLRRALAGGGKVRVTEFGPPDIGLACFLLTWFGWLVYKGFTSATHPVTNADVVAGAIHVILLVFIILAFLGFRKFAIVVQFGLRGIGLLRTPVSAVALLIAAWPLIILAAALMHKLLGPDAKQQELVQFFVEASKKGNLVQVFTVITLGVVVAPMAEEFIFRGYLYAVFKSRLGLLPAMILNAGLFAAIHLNLASLPSLFVLAVCFTIAYETTGSILVSMGMHALFNLIMLFAMLANPGSTS